MRNRSERSRGSEHFPKVHCVRSTWPYSQACLPTSTSTSLAYNNAHPPSTQRDVIHTIIPFGLVATLFPFDSKQQQPLRTTPTARCLTELYLARQWGGCVDG